MLRNILLCGLMVSVMALLGCAKREGEAPRAETAKAGLMPGVDGGFEPTYLADQKQITMAGDVSVSLEPLETFREAKAAKAESSSEGDEAGATDASATSQGDDEWEEEDDDGWGDDDKAKEAAPADTNKDAPTEGEEEAKG